MAEQQRLADIQKNGRERVRISLSEFKGVRFIDLRTFATDNTGALVPTKHGVTLRRDMLQPTIEALQQAEHLLSKGGAVR